MAHSIADFVEVMAALLPQGDAWRLDSNPELKQRLTAMAHTFARLDADIDAMFDESLPSKTVAWLSDWETDWGLPDNSCVPAPTTLPQRQQLLGARVTAIGGDDRKRLLDTAAKLGNPSIGITEFKPGDTVPGHPSIDPQDAAFFILVSIFELYGETWLEAGTGAAGDPLHSWDAGHLKRFKCELNRIIHSHKTLLFEV